MDIGETQLQGSTEHDQSTQSAVPNLADIDSKIVLKFVKEGRRSKTYISGLELFLQKKADREKLCQDLRKVLGAGSNIVTDENDKEKYGFQGDHIERIKKFLMTKHNIPREKIE